MRRLLLCLFLGFIFASACTKKSSTTDPSDSGPSEDSSASGIAAAAAGGTLSMFANGSSPTLGYQTPQKTPLILRLLGEVKADASGACPTFMSANGAGCSNTSTSLVTVTYSSCSFGSSTATWSGSDSINLSSGTIQCGTYPTLPTPTAIFGHGFTGTRTASSGTVIHSAIDLTNYTGTSASNQWEQVRFSSGTLNTMILSGIRFTSTSPAIDYTLDQYFSFGLTVGTTGTGRTVSGSMKVHDNNEKVTGITTFYSVGYTDSCCQPTSGTIATSFAAGTNGNSSSSYDGKAEALVFNGTCGQAQFTSVDGTTKTVNLVHCL